MEVHFDEKTIVVDDYKSIKGYGIDINEFSNKNSEKGQLEELASVYDCLMSERKDVQTYTGPIELWDIIHTTDISLMIQGGEKQN